MGNQQVTSCVFAAIWCSVKIGLPPIPPGMEAYGPPERLGVPEAQAKDESA